MWISRRAVLNGFGQSATLGALAATLPTQLTAAAAAAPAPAPAAAPAAPAVTYCLTRLYQRAEATPFDGDGFRDRHVPTLIRAYGKSAERIELRMPVVAEGAVPPQIIAAANIWFSNPQEFLAKHKAAEKELVASMATVTKALAVEQVDQVLTSLGDERNSVPIDCFVYSTYFPAREGGTMDTKYFAETFYPKFVATYGTEAVRRVEVTSAATPKSMVVGSTHVYIREPDAYDAAREKAPELFKELTAYTNINPMQTLTRLHAFG
jgi:hypothetical protein